MRPICGKFQRADNPFHIGYDSELDISPELTSDTASYFQTIIIILVCMIEIGRTDTIT